MAYITWAAELDTGIPVIDKQHRSIVALINELRLAQTRESGRGAIEKAIRHLADCMSSHFALEEELQAKAGYPYRKAHRRLHELFMNKVSSYQERFSAGEDVILEMADVLGKGLTNHFTYDDGDYAPLVRDALPPEAEASSGWLGGALGKFLAGKAA